MSNESIRNTVSLMLITVIAGLLLGIVYEITKEPIENEKQRAKEEAYREVFTDAESFKAMEVNADKELEKLGFAVTINEVMQVLDKSGAVMGYVLTITDHEGYGGDIQFAMGVKNDGTVNGISFLSISETAGLGMKAVEDDFKKQFAGRQVDQFTYTKSEAVADNEIDAISGATITTNAVINGVNAGIYYVSTLE